MCWSQIRTAAWIFLFFLQKKKHSSGYLTHSSDFRDCHLSLRNLVTRKYLNLIPWEASKLSSYRIFARYKASWLLWAYSANVKGGVCNIRSNILSTSHSLLFFSFLSLPWIINFCFILREFEIKSAPFSPPSSKQRVKVRNKYRGRWEEWQVAIRRYGTCPC